MTEFAVRVLDAEGFALLASGAPPSEGFVLTEPPLAPPEVLEMLRGIADGLRSEFPENAWIALDGSRVAAMCSITRHGVPGEPEIGYGTAPGEQGRGAASALVAGVIAWAETTGRVNALRAETGSGNIASQRVLERTGFVRTGERDDAEDGALVCWRWQRGSLAAGSFEALGEAHEHSHPA